MKTLLLLLLSFCLLYGEEQEYIIEEEYTVKFTVIKTDWYTGKSFILQYDEKLTIKNLLKIKPILTANEWEMFHKFGLFVILIYDNVA